MCLCPCYWLIGVALHLVCPLACLYNCAQTLLVTFDLYKNKCSQMIYVILV